MGNMTEGELSVENKLQAKNLGPWCGTRVMNSMGHLKCLDGLGGSLYVARAISKQIVWNMWAWYNFVFLTWTLPETSIQPHIISSP